MTMTALQQMKDIDIRTVDTEALVDIDSVNVNPDLPKYERMTDMAKQMNGNLYCFKCRRKDGGYIAVKSSFLDTAVSLDERMEDYLRTM